MITVSTAWNAWRHASGEEVIRELVGLGFGSFELSVKLTETELMEIDAISLGIEVHTLHNYCPVPHGSADDGGGDFYLLSSPDPKERTRAVDASKHTLDWAHRLGANAVVFHLGRVEMENNYEHVLSLRESGQTVEAEAFLREDLALREELKAPYLEAALRSIEELARFTDKVKIGVETRFHYHELPSLDEIALFLDVVGEKGGYWHDFGHAWINDHIGVSKHEEYLSRYGSRAIGMHVHDVEGTRDHSSLTCGTIDFAKLLPMLPKTATSVLEIQHATPEELVKSREIWQNLLAHNK
jgi:sugar phosphate isomerase/epimerase